MPNYVRSDVTVKGTTEDVERFHNLMFENAEQPFDFDAILPMPPILQRVNSPAQRGPNGRTMLIDPVAPDKPWCWIEATVDEQAELDQQEYPSWYEWATANWNTKWPASDVVATKPGQFSFDTAWDVPTPIFYRLAELFPTLTFDIKSIDEGLGFEARGQIGAKVDEPFQYYKIDQDLFEDVERPNESPGFDEPDAPF